MTIQTKVKFYYGQIITKQNRSIPIDEGAGEINVSLRVGIYSLTDFATEIERALNSTGTLDYTVTVDRGTRIFTISASGSFELLFGTGITVGTSAASVIGFNDSDTGSGTSHVGDFASGSEFVPQFLLQDFKDFDNNVKSTLASVNQSANGRNVEVVSFGRVGFLECNILFQTDNPQAVKGGPIDNDPNGVDNLRNFLSFATLKGNMEFMPDKNDSNVFTKVILESTSQSPSGTDYEVSEMISRNLVGYYESGKLVFRRIT